MNRYRIVERLTQKVVAEGFSTRSAARQAKRELEFKAQQEAHSENRPAAYAVETGEDNKRGAGIYLH